MVKYLFNKKFQRNLGNNKRIKGVKVIYKEKNKTKNSN